MSRIAPVTQPQGKTKQLLDGVEKAVGRVPNLYRVTAQSPAALEGLLALSGALSKSTLSRKLREQIALAVGERNGCDYCLAAHSLHGKKAGLSDADIAQARQARAAESASEAALRFVARVVDQRGQVSDADLDALRHAGFSDGDIVELVAETVANIFTNTLNNVALTEIDFPSVRGAARHAA